MPMPSPDSGPLVSLGTLESQTREVFRIGRKTGLLHDASGGYFCLSDGRTGATHCIIRVGQFENSVMSDVCLLLVRDKARKTADSRRESAVRCLAPAGSANGQSLEQVPILLSFSCGMYPDSSEERKEYLIALAVAARCYFLTPEQAIAEAHERGGCSPAEFQQLLGLEAAAA